ncbi:MAG: Gfo/Idh/MocA family oxidoreductase [Bacillota bacterium]|nr:Gfo/Idh/MocA family oxidoreductase [Bacillota bacterium]
MSRRVLVIGGAGDLGRNRILPALGQLGLHADVVDPQPFPGNMPAAVARAYPSLECLGSTDGDCYLGAIVASPNHLHLRHCRWALGAARAPCLCEKPIAHTLDDAREMARLASGPVPLWTADHYLAKPPSDFLLARGPELLSSVGPLRRVRGRILEPAGTLAGRGWLRDPDRAGGGIWVDTGVHLVTLLLSLPAAATPGHPALAESPWQIRSAAARGYDEDLGLAETYFRLSAAAGQTEIILEVGKTVDEPAKDLLLEGIGGTIQLDWQAGTVRRDGDTVYADADPPFGGYLALLESFAAVCRHRQRAETPAAPGLVACELAERALRILKSAYACADLPPRLREACLR